MNRPVYHDKMFAKQAEMLSSDNTLSETFGIGLPKYIGAAAAVIITAVYGK